MDRKQIIDFVFNYYTGHSANIIGSFDDPLPTITLASVVDCIERVLDAEHQRQLNLIVTGGRYGSDER